MRRIILVLATALLALLICRRQEENLLWEARMEQERLQNEALALMAAMAEEESEPERLVLTEAQRTRLDTYLSEREGNWSVYLKDITSGETYTYNEEAVYYPASLMKAPYALWIAQKADTGELSLAQKIPNTKRGVLAGSDMEKYNNAKAISVAAVLHSMIAHSNNDAVTLLANQWPGIKETGFEEFLSGLDFSYVETIQMDGKGIQGMITVTDIGHTMEALYDYFEGDSYNAYQLKRCFLASPHQILYVPKGVPAAKKYGSWQYAYHDAAIIYDTYPYILCVMTDRGLETVDFPEEPTKAMQKLGRMVNEMLK